MTKEKSSIEHRLYSEGDRGSLRFYQLSKEILLNDKYERLSHGATLLYALLFDRLQLSISNNRKDDQGRYFLQFKVKPAQGDLRPRREKPQAERSLTEVLRSNAKTITKYKNELKDAELLLEVKEGLGRVNRMYLAKPCTGEDTPPDTTENPALEENLPTDATEKTSQGEGVMSPQTTQEIHQRQGILSPQTTQKIHPSEGILPPQTTRKLPLGGGIITPQRGSELPPNDTDLNETYFNDTDFNEINQSNKNKADRKESLLTDNTLTAFSPGVRNAVQNPKPRQNFGIKSHDEIHKTLVEAYGKELLSEGLAIIENRVVSKYGYQKYLTKILEDLTGRRKSQGLYKSSEKGRTSTEPKTAFHLRESRYRNMSEEELLAGIRRKKETLKET